MIEFARNAQCGNPFASFLVEVTCIGDCRRVDAMWSHVLVLRHLCECTRGPNSAATAASSDPNRGRRWSRSAPSAQAICANLCSPSIDADNHVRKAGANSLQMVEDYADFGIRLPDPVDLDSADMSMMSAKASTPPMCPLDRVGVHLAPLS